MSRAAPGSTGSRQAVSYRQCGTAKRAGHSPCACRRPSEGSVLQWCRKHCAFLSEPCLLALILHKWLCALQQHQLRQPFNLPLLRTLGRAPALPSARSPAGRSTAMGVLPPAAAPAAGDATRGDRGAAAGCSIAWHSLPKNRACTGCEESGWLQSMLWREHERRCRASRQGPPRDMAA